MNVDLGFNTVHELRKLLVAECDFLEFLNERPKSKLSCTVDVSKQKIRGEIKSPKNRSYFFSNPIARASETMAKLDKLRGGSPPLNEGLKY